MKKIIASVLFILFFAVSASAGGYGNGNYGNNNSMAGGGNQNLISYLETIGPDEVDDAEIEALKYMIEEEKLARDVYSELYLKWGIRVFQNITRSEQTHMNAVNYLLDVYEIENPVADFEEASFSNTELQELYFTLVENGSYGMIDALYVGATIEDLDIYDLQKYLDVTDNEDIKVVFQNLMKGSRNHLRSFVSLLERNGVEYVAQYLTREEVDEIIESDRERGLVDADGNPVSVTNGYSLRY